MDPDQASTSTTGPAPMNRLPHGPRSKAEAGEHGIPVDAEPDELDEPAGDEPMGDEPMGDEPTGDEPTGDEPTGEDRSASGSGSLG